MHQLERKSLVIFKPNNKRFFCSKTTKRAFCEKMFSPRKPFCMITITIECNNCLNDEKNIEIIVPL